MPQPPEICLFSIPHHSLEVGPLIGLAADGPVLIGSNDVQPQLGSVLHALSDLLLNADLSLVVGGIAGINDGILTRSNILFRAINHHLTIIFFKIRNIFRFSV